MNTENQRLLFIYFLTFYSVQVSPQPWDGAASTQGGFLLLSFGSTLRSKLRGYVSYVILNPVKLTVKMTHTGHQI